MNQSEPETIKNHFVGSVEYAQHNFARLKPLLFSTTGRRWDGLVDRQWFPNEGLVFTVQADLRYAQVGSLWIFRVARNSRASASDKDAFVAIQCKPAVELIVGMEPLEAETLRRLVSEEGLPNAPAGKSGAAVPEVNDRWVVLNELQRDEHGRGRPAASVNLKLLKVLVGTPQELCGLPTPDEHFVLPPIPSVSGEYRNWVPPAQFLETLAADLKRWVPYGPQRSKVQTAAAVLRELAPQMAGLSALRADDAKVAMARAASLVDAAQTVTAAVETILDLIVEQEPFKAEIERRRAAIDEELEAEALAAVELKEGAARDRLQAEQASIQAEIDCSTSRLEALKGELFALEAEANAMRSAREQTVDALGAQVDALVQRAASEPARVLAEWIGVSGFVVGRMGGEPAPPLHDAGRSAPIPANVPHVIRPIDTADLGPALFAAGPASNPGYPRLLIIDAALRARELPVLIGPFAREFAEAWLAVAGGDAPLAIMTDPTLLALHDLTPAGSRGEKAPLHAGFLRASSQKEPVVVLLDDLDPAAAGFWLPELARCQRRPDRYGFPPNLLFIAVVEADASQMNLTQLRAGELFPLVFDDCDPSGTVPVRPDTPFTLMADLLVGPAASTGWPARVAALEAALRVTFKAEDARSIAAEFADFLQHSKGSGSPPRTAASLASLLSRSADRLIGAGAKGG